MAISASEKQSKPSKRFQENDHCFFHSLLPKVFFSIPGIVFLLVLIYVWSSSTSVISDNVAHLCGSSRKLNNLYCLLAGTQPNFEIPVSLVNESYISTSNGEVGNVKKVADFVLKSSISIQPSFEIPVSLVNDSYIPAGNGEGGNVQKVADSELKSSISAVRNGNDRDGDEALADAYKDVEEKIKVHRSWASDSDHESCDGQGIYVYELPPKFNKDLLAQCGDMIPWMDFCRFLSNGALGEPIQKLGEAWYNTHQYSLELIFHARVLKHPCRVYDPNGAKLFYVPYYGGLDMLRWHFKNVSDDVKDLLGSELLRWLESQGPWYRYLGKDHVFVLGKISWDFRRNEKYSWGSRFLELDEMQNPIKLLIERQPWHVNDVGIPHPTYFHPRTDNDIVSWQLKIIKSDRKSLVSFAGAARPDSPNNVRSILIQQCISTSNEECKFLNCSSGVCDQPESIIELFTESEFCLQPPGDSPTRKSVFDSLTSGCIPVLFNPFTAYYQYPWHLPQEVDKYSVYIDEDEVRNRSVNVVERLMRIPSKERKNMRRYIVYELLPGLVYGGSNSKFDKFQDAFSITVNNLLQRLKRLNEL